MTHPRRTLEAYLEGRLSPAREARVADHLRGCEACRARYDEAVRLRRALAGDPSAPTPQERAVLARRVADRVRSGALGTGERAPLPASRPVQLAFGTAAAVALAVGLFVAFGLSASPVVGEIRTATGVTVDGRPAEPGTPVHAGERLATAAEGLAVVDLVERGTMRVFPGTRLAVGGGAEEVRLLGGEVWFRIQPGHGRFVVRTARGTAEVLGTSFVVEDRGETMEVRVLEGRVRVEDRDHLGQVRVGANQKTLIAPKGPPSPPLRYDPRDDENAWERFWRSVWQALQGAVEAVKGALGGTR